MLKDIKMMVFRIFRFLVFSSVSIIFFISCSEQEEPIISNDDADDDTQVLNNEYEDINYWIYENMESYYYWNEKLPNVHLLFSVN